MRTQLASSWMSPSPPTTAIEIASRRVTVVEMGQSSGGPSVVAFASEPLPDDAVVPAVPGARTVRCPDLTTFVGVWNRLVAR